MPKKLYAVLVGINNYSHKPLSGCINDVLEMKSYLEDVVRDNKELEELQLKMLLAPRAPIDDEALAQAHLSPEQYADPTRQNIIDSFSHFNNANPDRGDICLFYFSGHGSIQDAPAAFWHMKSAKQLETLVCSDSRPGGHDLVDKELAYLIWRSMHKKEKIAGKRPGVHFLAIMDCCHAGDNSRGMDDLVVSREDNPNPNRLEFEHFLGAKEQGFYIPRPDNRFDIHHGRHVHLAAARESESAKELRLDAKRQGVFTFSLLKALKNGGLQSTYRELMQNVGIAVRNRVDEQIPILGTTKDEDENLQFLGAKLQAPKEEYTVAFRNKNTVKEWFIKVGSINGIVPTSENMGKTQLQIIDVANVSNPSRLVAVNEVRLSESILDSSAFPEAEEQEAPGRFKAVVHSMAAPKIEVAIADDLDPIMKTKFENELRQRPSKFFNISETNLDANYIIKNIKKDYVLTKNGSETPVFLRSEDPFEFNERVNAVGKWWSIMELKNPNTDIDKKHIDIHIEVIEGQKTFSNFITQHDDYAPTKTLLNPKTIELNYSGVHVQGKAYQAPPGIRVKISSLKNTHFISALILGNEFGVTHRLKTTKITPEGMGAWLTKPVNGNLENKTITLTFDPTYHNWGISSITDYLKIFISTEYFDISAYQQASLPLDRGIGRADDGESLPLGVFADWTCITIPITTNRAIPAGKHKIKINGDHPSTAPGEIGKASIVAPSGFSATIAAASSAQIKKRLEAINEERSGDLTDVKLQAALLPPTSIWGNIAGSKTVFNRGLAASDSDSNLSVLEFEKIDGQLSKDNFITFIPEEELDLDEVIIPYGYDEVSELYFPLGLTDDDGIVRITELPPPSTGQIFEHGSIDDRSFKSSVKVFLKKIFVSPFTGKKDYNVLAICQDSGQGVPISTDYLSDPKKKNILLLVHGILGDTIDLKKAIFERTDLSKGFDTILSYDYENLNTDIQVTAEDLKERLSDAGLFREPEQRLTIVAHSMGGLVSRCFIELEGGDVVTKRLVQLGTPNAGSETADFRKSLFGLITMGMNGLVFLKPYMPILAFIGKKAEKAVFKTLDQMSPKNTNFWDLLNAPSNGRPAHVQYRLIGGNTSLIATKINEEDPFWKKWGASIRERGHYEAIDRLIFRDGKDNDMAVTLESMKAVPGFKPTDIHLLACDHITYFINTESLDILSKLLQE